MASSLSGGNERPQSYLPLENVATKGRDRKILVNDMNTRDTLTVNNKPGETLFTLIVGAAMTARDLIR